jgi:ATP-binding cassette subfamily B protein
MSYDYRLIKPESDSSSTSGRPLAARGALSSFTQYVRGEERSIAVALLAICFNTAATIATPYLIAYAIDHYILKRDIPGLGKILFILLGIYTIGLVMSYLQAYLTGMISQRVLYRLRLAVFTKLQDLPLAFFTQNKAGDVMSRINNDTDKINTFLGQGLGRLLSNIFVVIGIGIFVFVLNPRLAAVLVASVVLIIIATKLLSSWSSRLNKQALATLGAFTSEIEENLNNFKVIVAFGRRDYFQTNIGASNDTNFRSTVTGVFSGQLFGPIYTASGNLAQLLVLLVGISLIASGNLTIGLLVGFISYTQQFYSPLQQIGASLGDIQTAIAAWSRLRDLLNLESEIVVTSEPATSDEIEGPLMSFDAVQFSYGTGELVLHDVSLHLGHGKTYAIVGPTGGGKSTVAALMARLYDPIAGAVTLNGRDLRSYTSSELAARIGFILQEPFLFTGTVGDNIRYGNPALNHYTNERLALHLKDEGLEHLLVRFEDGLNTAVSSGSENISLGQKQLISFVRAILRHPELIIMDEATANIDTVTEQLLGEVVAKLPQRTTKVIIAHRLNTIESAEEIIFINGGRAQPSLTFAEAIHLLDATHKQS